MMYCFYCLLLESTENEFNRNKSIFVTINIGLFQIFKPGKQTYKSNPNSVAVPGFDLSGRGREHCQGGGVENH